MEKAGSLRTVMGRNIFPGIVRLQLMLLLLAATVLAAGNRASASDPEVSEMKCSPGVEQLQESSGVCAGQESGLTGTVPERSIFLLIPPQSSQAILSERPPAAVAKAAEAKKPDKKTIVYFFWGDGCPHCEEEKSYLESLKREHSSLDIRGYEVWSNKDNAKLMAAMLQAHGVQSSGVPVTFVHHEMFSGFTKQTAALIDKKISECRKISCGDPADILKKKDQAERAADTGPSVSEPQRPVEQVEAANSSVTIPLLGAMDARNSSLPLLTLIIAGMDSFNPCAFFVLLSLLSLMVHARSRNRMLLIGGIFVFFSGFIYFLFMAAWLNLFLFMGQVAVITSIAGVVSIIIAAINIKDFFLFKQGISLTIPDSAKPKLFDRMRKLLHSTSIFSLMIGTTVLAVVANSYELLCTAGFPMVFTRVLTLNKLSTATYYLYLVLYNIIYIIPLFIIVLFFTYTLGRRQLSEWQGRVLKLVSGAMMLGLGTVLLFNPALLNSVQASFIILVSALAVSFAVAVVTRRWSH